MAVGTKQEPTNILLVDDQPAKLLTYEAILNPLGERLIKANSGEEALEHLLKNDIAVILVDVCMPDLDGYELAAMIREHPRFKKTAIIFISAVLLGEMDSLRGYEMGAVDYVPVPVVPEVLRAKVKVFCELYRKTRQLEVLNQELEERVAARTVELEKSTARLRQSEERRSLALAAGQMGSWEWDCRKDVHIWDAGQFRIFGVDQSCFAVTPENIRALVLPDDWEMMRRAFEMMAHGKYSHQFEFRVRRPDGEIRWCGSSAAATVDENGQLIRISGVTFDITSRKETEERQALLAREVDHRAKNALSLVLAILKLTRADDVKSYIKSIEGRIRALSHAHNLLSESRWMSANLVNLISEELAPFEGSIKGRISQAGPDVRLKPAAAQNLALAIHELATNAAKYGALSDPQGRLYVEWAVEDGGLRLAWREVVGWKCVSPKHSGFGTKIIFESVEQQLRGRVDLDWKETGLVCKMNFPLGMNIEFNGHDGRGAPFGI